VVARNAGLVAYVVPSDSAEGVPLSDDLKAFAAKNLPDYMVPAIYVTLDELPLTVAGKVDRAALPAPERSGPVATGGFLAPVTPTEQALADLWAGVLELEQVGVEDNFFDLGGHSLLVTRAVAMARAGGFDVSVTDFYDAPTISSLAQRVTLRESLDTAHAGSTVAIRRGTTRPVVFCVHEVGGGAAEFQELASGLDHGQQLVGFQSRGLFDDAPPLETVEQMASAYVEEVLTIQPDGPYLLTGVSMGAYIALEMAYQLGDRGKQIGAVAMLGAPKPNPGIRTGKSTDYRMRETLSEQIDLALQGPPGTSLPALYQKWFMEEWTLNADEVARLQAGDKAMLRLVRVVETNRQASMRYQSTIDRRHRTKLRRRPKPYQERVVLFLPEDGPEASNEAAVERWTTVLHAEPEVQMAPGNHYSIIKGDGAAVMGRFLAAEVDRLAL
jgi:thioesterase domain-containing protein